MERLGVFSFHACHSRGACAGLDPVAGIRKSMVMGDGSVNILYGMGRTDGTFRDQFIGTLNQARFHKMSKRHDLALECVDEVLAADPDFPEALFLKAQILWEGYQDAAAAKKCLIHLMKAEPDKEATFHRWGLSLYKEIAGYERSQNKHFLK